MPNNAKLGGVVPGFGSKRMLASQIVERFQPHTTYYEPFAFSASVLLEKEPCRLEIASDLNPDVANLLKVLSDFESAKTIYEMASCWLASESRFNYAVASLAEPWDGSFSVPRAWHYLVVAWQGPSGLCGTRAKTRFAKRNTASGGSLPARWKSVAPCVPWWHERLRDVEFRCADAFEILEDMPDREDVLGYLDPPYHPDSRRGGLYKFDFVDENGDHDVSMHERLAARLSEFRHAQIVVSYGYCEALAELYEGWHVERLDANRKLGNETGGEQGIESAGEVLFMNWKPQRSLLT